MCLLPVIIKESVLHGRAGGSGPELSNKNHEKRENKPVSNPHSKQKDELLIN